MKWGKREARKGWASNHAASNPLRSRGEASERSTERSRRSPRYGRATLLSLKSAPKNNGTWWNRLRKKVRVGSALPEKRSDRAVRLSSPKSLLQGGRRATVSESSRTFLASSPLRPRSEASALRLARASAARHATSEPSTWGVMARRMVAVMIVAGAAWATVHMYHYAMTDSRFLVRIIDVRGTARLNSEEVLRWSGLHAGSNIFEAPLGAVEDRLKRRGVFSKVTVSRRLPDTIQIEVKERYPLVTVGNFQIDEEGFVSPRMVAAQPGGFPIPLEGMKVKGLEIGRTTQDAEVMVGLAVAGAVRHQGDILVKRIIVEDALNPCLILMNDIQVKMGSQHFENKLERIHEVLAALEQKKRLPKIIDLRYRDEAAVTFK